MARRLTSCDQHTVSIDGYLAFHEDAERRTARGERQYRCGECGLWQWPEPTPARVFGSSVFPSGSGEGS